MRELPRRTLAALALLWSPALANAWDRCEASAPREAREDAAGITRIEIDAGAGSLHVDGRDGVTGVHATGKACAEDPDDLDEVQIRMTRSGGTLRIETRLARDGDTRLDLEIEMPKGLALEVEDSSGELEIRGAGATRIQDSSGSIELSDVTGDVSIRDGSGSIEVRQVAGDVRVEDGSGSIEIERVQGSVIVEDDGAGGIRISEVSRDVHIEEDGSGSIDVRDVGGDFRVDRDGSGSVRYHDVTGEVSVPHR